MITPILPICKMDLRKPPIPNNSYSSKKKPSVAFNKVLEEILKPAQQTASKPS